MVEGGRNLACRGLTFVAPYVAAYLLDISCNIAEVDQLLFPILVGWVPPFEETIDWIQFAYTADRTGAYVAPASTVLVPSAVSEGDPLFPAICRHLMRRFSGAYAMTLTMRSPLGLD